MALDPKQKASLATKGAKKPTHEEPDGDEAEGAEHDDGEPEEPEAEPEPTEKTDKEFAKFCQSAIEKGFVNPKIRALMAGHDQEEKAPDWVEDDALWTRAVAAVQPREDGADENEHLWLQIGATYSMLGGGIKQGTTIPEMPAAETKDEPADEDPGMEVENEG